MSGRCTRDAQSMNSVVFAVIFMVLLLVAFAFAMGSAVCYVWSTRRMLSIVRSEYPELWRQHGAPAPLRANPLRGLIDSSGEIVLARAAAKALSTSDGRIARFATRRRKAAVIMMVCFAGFAIVGVAGLLCAVIFRHYGWLTGP